jgi:hypothetical protein
VSLTAGARISRTGIVVACARRSAPSLHVWHFHQFSPVTSAAASAGRSTACSSWHTGWNLHDAGATLPLSGGKLTRSTQFTVEVRQRLGEPHSVVSLPGEIDPGAVADCITSGSIIVA